ncbi:unnamed protein product [Urochloa decumbens]|uniref:Uncharacterized protein n=1 Tax=Urochloa decumbens TaxID=240449 RepID=A0ABC8ZPV1_9POAL
MEDNAAVKSTGRKWRLVQFVGAILFFLLYAAPFSTLPAPYVSTADFFFAAGGGGVPVSLDNQVGSPCSSLRNHSICCDRSDANADVCFMAGDVRTDAASLSLLLFPPPGAAAATVDMMKEERIKPYTRKWDGKVMGEIPELRLRVAAPEEAAAGHHRCDVRHDAPAHVAAAAGGYNGHNYFHAFNDGLLPSWLTVQHLRRRVVLAALSYTPRWAATYAEVISGLSEHPVVDLLGGGDTRTHCFPGAIVGTRFHGYLAVDPARLRDRKTILDFHRFLAGVFEPSSTSTSSSSQVSSSKPRLGIVSRRGTRVIENEEAVARLAASAGFDVGVVGTGGGGGGGGSRPPLSAVYASVRGYDALVGVHGSDLTSFLFLRPGRGALAQVAPLGVAGLSRELFGAPAARMGLHYEQYDVSGRESSLSRRYPEGHVVVADPERAKRRRGSDREGDWDWDFIGRVYLNGQNVSLDLDRFGKTLARMRSQLLRLTEADELALARI